MATLNTKVDAAVRVVEDVVVVTGAAASAWLSSHDVTTTLAAVTGAPVLRSGLAGLLSQGRVSGLALAVRLVWKALNAAEAASPPAVVATRSTVPVPTPVPIEPGPQAVTDAML